MMARYASYETLAEIVRRRFEAPTATLRELFGRMIFNVLVGNTDDHARNHAAFLDGRLTLTPADDIRPQQRTGGEAAQAMRIRGTRSFSRIDLCLDAAPTFLIDRERTIGIVRTQIDTLRGRWNDVCDECALPLPARRTTWGRQILDPYAFVALDDDLLDRLGASGPDGPSGQPDG